MQREAHCPDPLQTSPEGQTSPQVTPVKLLGWASDERQLLPQPPQFALSVLVSTQKPLQSMKPETQLVLHVPPEQAVGPRQRLPQPPQLALSVLSSTQLPLHSVSPPMQLWPQLPAEQTRSPEQWFPQLPQLALSVWVSTQ
jgi:hypothetical protein